MLIGLVYDSQDDYMPYIDAPADEKAELSYDYEISNLTTAIESLGHTVVDIGDIEKLCRFLYSDKSVDLIFNYAVGKRGSTREAQVPALLEGIQIPYTGADAFSLSIGNDKAVCKQIWKNAGLPVGDFFIVTEQADLDEIIKKLPGYPLFIKPIREGSSKGLFLAYSEQELRNAIKKITIQYRQAAIIESFLPGREYTVGIIGSRRDARALGVVELLSDSKIFRDYEEKKRRKSDGSTFIPVESESLRSQLMELGTLAYRAVDCQVIGRVDIRCDKNDNLILMEINANPALKSTDSAMPATAKMSGISYPQLLGMIIDMAIERWSL